MFRLLGWHKRHLGAFPNLVRVRLPVRSPFFFRHRQNRRAQRLRQARADRKTDESFRSLRSLLVPQPVQQIFFMARRVPAKIVRFHGLRQGRKRPLRHP